MLELALSLLILAGLAWQVRRWLHEAYDNGVREGYALAERNARQRNDDGRNR